MAQGYWRDSARTPKFYFVDGNAAFPLLLFILHMSLWTLALAVGAMFFFSLLQRYGFTIKIFLRWFRNVLAGNCKIAKPWWY